MGDVSVERDRGITAAPSSYGAGPGVSGEVGAASRKRHDLVREVVAWSKRNCVREMWDWARCKRVTVPRVEQLTEVIRVLGNSGRVYEESETESPIFLLATGWRSGSTLLQRILVTDSRVLLWGEPLGEMALLSELAGIITRLFTFPELQKRCEAGDQVFSSLSTSWIATLYPPGGDFRRGLQALLTGWLAEPARRRGFSRWGFKEVRIGAAEAILLRWIYPKAKFVLLSRNPYDCYRSLSDSGWHHLYHARPEIRVDSAAGLARHWNRIALSWMELPPDFPAFRIKYEDLIAGKTEFRELESWLGLKLDESTALSAFVSRTARRHRLRLCERWIISHEAAAGMRALGYSKPDEQEIEGSRRIRESRSGSVWTNQHD